jgi:hypothetical protein
MSFEKRKEDAFLTIKRKEEIKKLKEENIDKFKETYSSLAEYELNKSTGAVQRVNND